MGLFSSFKKGGSNVSNSTLNWLNDADEAYLKAFNTSSMAGCEKYFSRDVYRKIAEDVRRLGKTYSGITRYRHVTWKMVEQGVYQRIVTFDQMQISKGIQAKVGDDSTEEWSLGATDDGTKVTKIRRVS